MNAHPVDRYLKSIRNYAKNRYAADYYQWLIGQAKVEPQKPDGLSVMAAQAVRLRLAELRR